MRGSIFIRQNLVIWQIEGILAPHQTDEIVPQVFGDDVVLRYQDKVLGAFSPEMGCHQGAGALAEVIDLRTGSQGYQAPEKGGLLQLRGYLLIKHGSC
ncbi:hypothetical protein DSECCO2_451810 [anaerobic digester metagenome]